MKLTVLEDFGICLEDVFNGIVLKPVGGNNLYICMRDDGFEFSYNGVKYFAKGGVVGKMLDDFKSTVEEGVKVVDSVGTNIHVRSDGSHRHGVCYRYGKTSDMVDKCEVKEVSGYKVCPVCGVRDIKVIKEDEKPFSGDGE